jgi:hypothetical protein
MTFTRLKIMGLVVAISLLVGVYFVFNPIGFSFFPKCPFYALTRLYCPGCGSQRAFHALLHGHLLQAAGFNLLAVLALPFVIYSGVVSVGNHFLSRQWKQDIFYKPWFAWMVLGLVLLFWLLRNLPFSCFSWMAP